MVREPGSLRRLSETDRVASKFMLIYRGGAVSRGDVSPTELQAHVAKWYTWSDELTRHLVPGQQHTFQMAVGRSTVADDAVQRLATWVRPHLAL